MGTFRNSKKTLHIDVCNCFKYVSVYISSHFLHPAYPQMIHFGSVFILA